ncbi:hypothetical protein ACFCWX_42950, partial [Streptomyces sp. NPDC056405]
RTSRRLRLPRLQPHLLETPQEGQLMIVLRALRQDMVDALSAYIRDEALPPLSEETVEKQTRVARHEERQRQQFEHMHDPVNVDPGEEGDAFSPS